MKREEVKTKIPGITDEQLDWLMGENGRDITAEKTKAANLQTQVNDLTTQLNTAKDGLKAFEGVDVADLKGQITKLQGQLADQADSFAFDSTLDGAIRDTVYVPPMAMVTVALDAGEAARWMLHCHHMPHLFTGMMTEFAVTA